MKNNKHRCPDEFTVRHILSLANEWENTFNGQSLYRFIKENWNCDKDIITRTYSYPFNGGTEKTYTIDSTVLKFINTKTNKVLMEYVAKTNTQDNKLKHIFEWHLKQAPNAIKYNNHCFEYKQGEDIIRVYYSELF